MASNQRAAPSTVRRLTALLSDQRLQRRARWAETADGLVDVERALVRRPLRTLLTMLGVALGVAALACSTILSATTSAQVDARFDLAESTLLTADVPADSDPVSKVRNTVMRTPGVVEAGFFTPLEGRAADGVLLTRDVPAAPTARARLVVATAHGLLARSPRLLEGRIPSAAQLRREPRLVLVGQALATAADIGPDPGRDAILVSGQLCYVAGVIVDTSGTADLTLSVVAFLPAAGLFSDERATRRLVVRTEVGATQQVARDLPTVLSPQDPARLIVAAPADPAQLRRGIAKDTRNLTYALAAVALVIGAVGIANAMLVSVMERRPEIGIRRALGSTRRGIASLFLVEGGLVGLAGGLVGLTFGLAVTVGLCVVRDWHPEVATWVLFTPILGCVTGFLAGVYPSYRATLVEPVEALRT